MELADRINAALQLDQLDLPPKPKVVRLEWKPFEDWQGDESILVWIILADETKEEELKGGTGLTIKSEIRESMRKHGVTLFAYTRVAKESEYESIAKSI